MRSEPPSGWKGQGVLDQLGKGALQPRGIGQDRRQAGGKVKGQDDGAALGEALVHALAEEVVQVVFGQGDLGGADEVPKLLEDFFQAEDAAPDAFRQLAVLGPVVLGFRQQEFQLVEVALDGEGPVADHVGGFGRQLAPGGHALRVDQAV